MAGLVGGFLATLSATTFLVAVTQSRKEIFSCLENKVMFVVRKGLCYQMVRLGKQTGISASDFFFF